MPNSSNNKKVYANILQTIGSTPIVELNKCIGKSEHKFFGKIEYFNPGSSVKDRIALAIIEDAEKSGQLKPGGTIVEATSGNTGVGLALVAAVKGYKCIFVMPEKISEEKRATLRAYGARVVITPNGLDPDDPRSFYSVARKFAETTPNSYYTNQYHNPANVKKHYEMTGPEIWEQMDGQIDVFVGGAGTGGTISGVGRYLKEKNPNVRIVCADPFGSILYDMFYHKRIVNPPHTYLVEGIGEDMIPQNVHFEQLTDFVQVNDQQAFHFCREICRQEGILVGPSSGAALAAAVEFSKTLKQPARILSLFADSGKSYLSKAFDLNWLRSNDLIESSVKKFKVGEVSPLGIKRELEPKIGVDASIRQAIQLMREQNVTRLFVFDQLEFFGWLELRDLLKTLNEGKLRSDESILHLVQTNFQEVSMQDSALKLIELFKTQDFVRVQETRQLITQADFAEFISENEIQ